MIGKVIISDILKITKLSSRVPDAGKKKKGDTSRTHEGHAKWKTDHSFVDTQVLKTYLLKQLEAQTHMFISDYSCFITLKLKFEEEVKKIKAAITQSSENSCHLFVPLNR